MSEFHFQAIVYELPDQLLQKSFIWIWNADKIPPHIGISTGKDYYSLTYRKSEHLQTASMVKKAKRSAVPLVLVEIPSEILKHELPGVFQRYERAIDGITCLHPIRESMALDTKVSQLADLLELLESEKWIVQVNGVNLPEDYKGIPDYSMEEILNRIRLLNEVSG